MANATINLGSRVYYKDIGPEDAGTIIDILLDDNPFVVKWDKQYPSEYETVVFPPAEMAKKLGVKQRQFFVNKADENIDQFKGSQLVLLSSMEK